MIQKTSAVTTTVLGEVKIVGLLLLSALLLGKALPVLCLLGHGEKELSVLMHCIVFSCPTLPSQILPWLGCLVDSSLVSCITEVVCVFR